MNLRSLLVSCVSIVVLIAIGFASAASAQNVVADLELDPSQVRLIPKLPNEGMLLSVSGPDGFYYQRWFAASTEPVFPVKDEDGARATDGIYTYELRLAPELLPEARSLLVMAQQTDNDSIIDDLRSRGLLPQPQVQSGTFTIKSGSVQIPQSHIESESMAKDIPMLDDTIIEGRMCVGIECLIDEDFDTTDDVLRLKQDKLRIHLDDTSTDTDFPTNSWRISINDLDQYGASYLAVEDVDAGTTPFKIRAGAPDSSLYVDPAGNVGIGTATPEAMLSVLGPVMVKSESVSATTTPSYENKPACDGCTSAKSLTPGVELHVLQGGTPPTSVNTKTGLLVQNTSADSDDSIINIMAGSSGNSQLFFGDPGSEYAGRVTYEHATDAMRFFTGEEERVRIDAEGDVGIGTSSPVADGLHIDRATGALADMLHLTNNGGSYLTFENTATSDTWYITHEHISPNRFIISSSATAGPQLAMATNGDMEVSGSLSTAVAGAGIGTASPVADGLHINTSTGASADILHLTNNGGSYVQFENTVTSDSWYFSHEHASPNRLIINSSAYTGPEFAMTNSGDLEISGTLSTAGVGIGTASPIGPIHVSSTGTVAPYFESTDGGAVQLRIRTNSTNRRIIALDGSDNQESQIVLGDNGSYDFWGPTSSDKRMSIDSSGNVNIEGNLVTGGGGTCDPGPCDATFTDYELESIEAHSAYMWENSHLWGVGPTPEGGPINLSQKTTGIIHELEKAHIYIEQLNDTLKAQQMALNAQQMMIEELKKELAELKSK
jgi:hypothetical protein